MRPIHTHVFENVISKPRLNSYRGYFATKDIDEAIGLYMWNCELSACFSMLLSFFEISLRNNVHREMSQHRSHSTSNSIHWYDKYNDLKSSIDDERHITIYKYDTKTKIKIKIKELRSPALKPDEIVSRLSFGFWIVALRKIEPWILQKIFPFHSLSTKLNDWTDKKKRKIALEPFEELKNFRNRIAHHEPLWKFSAIKDTSVNPAIIKVPESTNLEESLYRFKRLLDLLDDAMKAMNPDFHVDMMQSSWRRKLDYLLSEQGISRYKNLKHCPDINQHPLTPIQFRKKFKLIMKKNKPIQVGYSNMKGLFIPE